MVVEQTLMPGSVEPQAVFEMWSPSKGSERAMANWRDSVAPAGSVGRVRVQEAPLVFEGEPFFGQDRIGMARWRMEQKGLRPRDGG